MQDSKRTNKRSSIPPLPSPTATGTFHFRLANHLPQNCQLTIGWPSPTAIGQPTPTSVSEPKKTASGGPRPPQSTLAAIGTTRVDAPLGTQAPNVLHTIGDSQCACGPQKRQRSPGCWEASLSAYPEAMPGIVHVGGSSCRPVCSAKEAAFPEMATGGSGVGMSCTARWTWGPLAL